jgi:diguanylate cyclase (GGDEF)-like protein
MINTKAEIDALSVKREPTDSPDSNVRILELKTDDKTMTLEMTKMTITDVFKHPIGTMRIFKDITQERAFELQALHNANTDFLTGLYNRRYFYDYVNEHCIGKPLCVLFFDLDNFKSVNDTFGHKAGDEALILTASTLRKDFENDLIIRNGGDEFIVLMLTDDMNEINHRTKTILNDLNSSYKENSKFTKLTASIGVAVTSCFDTDIDRIIKQSDAALYSIKNTNKGNYCISNSTIG